MLIKLNVGKRSRGFPFPPSVNIMFIAVPKDRISSEDDLFDTKYLFTNGFQMEKNMMGTGLSKFWSVLCKQAKKMTNQDVTSKHPFVISSLEDWAKCLQWYPIAYKNNDGYLVIIEHPLNPMGIQTTRPKMTIDDGEFMFAYQLYINFVRVVFSRRQALFLKCRYS